MVNAIYAFSGDPITYGHIDIITRASKSFDQVIVGIGINPDKSYMFNLAERTEMAQRSLQHFSNVVVKPFEGLLVDFAYEQNLGVIVKGVRNSVDFNYENVLHQIGESQKLGIETHILFARPELSHISSSAVKSIQKEQGLIQEYVPLYVKQCVEQKMSGQYIVGVTGEIGVGKSYVCEAFRKLGQERGISVHNIELDTLVHQILHDLPHPRYDLVRSQIADTFGSRVLTPERHINRKELGRIVFFEDEALSQMQDIIHKPLLVRYRRELQGKTGLMLCNAELIAESGLSYLSNNNVVLVGCDEQTKNERLAQRSLDESQIQRRINTRFDSAHKRFLIETEIARERQGSIFMLDNSRDKDEIRFTFERVVTELGVR